jgi:hypothetical protein
MLPTFFISYPCSFNNSNNYYRLFCSSPPVNEKLHYEKYFYYFKHPGSNNFFRTAGIISERQ